MRLSLTRTVGFRATHRYFKPEWSPEENRTRFGLASEEPGHPHDYTCGVTLSGPPDPVTGMIIDLGVLDRVLTEVVVTPFDGRDINHDVPEFGYGKELPTCEALAQYYFERIAARLPAGVELERVMVAEDARLSAECTR